MRALAIVAVLLLAGCLDVPSIAPSADGKVVAVADSFREGGNRSVLIVREGGAAERLTYDFDGSWLPRLAPGLTYPREDLALAFEQADGVARGGLIVKIERGRLPGDALDVLEPYRAGAWPESLVPEGALAPWYRPDVFVRAEPRAVATAPPAAFGVSDVSGPVLALAAAFRGLDAAFEVGDAKEVLPPVSTPWDGCLQASTRVQPEVARLGEPVTLLTTVENCGGQAVTLDPTQCRDHPFLAVSIGSAFFPIAMKVPAGDTPRAAYALDLVCRGDLAPVVVAPGAQATLSRRWNGSIAACAEDRCEYRSARPGEFAVTSFASGQESAMPVLIKLVDADAPTVPFLLAREFDWLNATGTTPIAGDFGPHCAPVGYTREPPSVTIYHYGERPATPSAVIVRDWREGPRPGNVYTFSADRLDVALPTDGAANLASPFDETRVLAEVRLEGDAFVIDGTPLAPGETRVVRVEHAFDREGDRYESTSILLLEHMARAPLLWHQAFGCA